MSTGNSGINVTAGTLPSPYCPTSFQQMLNDFINLSTFAVTFSGGYFRQSTSPGTPPSGGPYLWAQTDSNGALVRWYSWNSTVGMWCAYHSVSANDNSIRMYIGTQASIPTYDGGDTNSAGLWSGPMWQLATQFHGANANTPPGSGTLASAGYPLAAGTVTDSNANAVIPSFVVNPGVAGYQSEVTHLSLGPETPPHAHNITWPNTAPPTFFGNETGGHVQDGGAGGNYAQYNDCPLATDPFPETGTPTVPHNNMPPYVGVWFLVRTGRLGYASN